MSTITTTCPTWCTLTSRELHQLLQPEDDHAGPDFGIFHIVGRNESDGTVTASVSSDAVAMLDAAGLRKVASDALAAAAWLEATR